MTTTLLFYGHWFPKGDRRYVELMESVRAAAPLLDVPTTADDAGVPLDHERLNTHSWHHFGTRSESGAPDVSEAPDLIGGPSRTRTLDPLIKRRGPVMSRPSSFFAHFRVTARSVGAFAA